MQTASKIHVPATSLSFTITFSRLFVSGGSTDDGTIASLDMHDSRRATSEWKQCDPMQEKRGIHAMIALNNQLFVFGGDNGSDILASCEK